MKETFRSPWFAAYVLANLLGTSAFFYLLHQRIIERDTWGIILISLLYAAAMYGLGAIFGPLVRTSDYHSEGKAFHIAAFLITNIVQLIWIAGFSPMNFIWFPFFFSAWSYGLWMHLRSEPQATIEKA